MLNGKLEPSASSGAASGISFPQWPNPAGYQYPEPPFRSGPGAAGAPHRWFLLSGKPRCGRHKTDRSHGRFLEGPGCGHWHIPETAVSHIRFCQG